jgi:serine/threonine protein kinase
VYSGFGLSCRHRLDNGAGLVNMDAYMNTAAAYGAAGDVTQEFELTDQQVKDAFGAEVVRPLGRGTFGETWRIDCAGQDPRAVKILLGQQTSQQRRDREVEALERVNCPNVVRLLDKGVTVVGGVDRAVLTFEYIDGGDLSHRLRPNQRVPRQDALLFAHGLFNGLRHLHDRDVVHRDIKPANVATRGGLWSQPVILDLGLIRMLDQESITRYPTMMGTALFMAPEQLRQERARKASDVFSAGVLLHLMLSGAHPFYDEDREIHIEEAIDLIEAGPKSLPDEVPPVFAEIILRLLSAGAGDRGSARRAFHDLDTALELLGA